MEVADSLTPKPMQVVDSLDDLDDILSTADNLAEALDIGPIKAEEPVKTNGEHCADDYNQSSEKETFENGDVIMLSEDEEANECHSEAGGVENDKKDEPKTTPECESLNNGTNSSKDSDKQETDAQTAVQATKDDDGVTGPETTQENCQIETHVIAESDEEDTEPAKQAAEEDKPEEEIDESDTKAPNGDVANGAVEQSDKEDSDVELITDVADEVDKEEEERFNEPETEPPLEEVTKSEVAPNNIENEEPEIKQTEKCETLHQDGKTDIVEPEVLAQKETKDEIHLIEDDVEISDSETNEAPEKEQKDEGEKSEEQESIEVVVISKSTPDKRAIEKIDIAKETDEKQETDDRPSEAKTNEPLLELTLESASDKTNIESAVDKSSESPKTVTNDKVKIEKVENEPEKEEDKNQCEIINLDDSDEEMVPKTKEESIKSKPEESLEGAEREQKDTATVSHEKNELLEKPDETEVPPQNATTEKANESLEDEFLMEIKSPRNIADDEDTTTDPERMDESMHIEIEPSSRETSNLDESMDIEEPQVGQKSPEARVIELSDDDTDANEDIKPPEPKRVAKESHDEKPRWSPKPSTSKAFQPHNDLSESAAETKPETLKKENNETISSEDEECVFFGKECINCECDHTSKKFYKSPHFILNLYKIQRKNNKNLFVCDTCYTLAVQKYEVLTRALLEGKPLIEQEIPKRQDYVEILDSSDEEEDEGQEKNKDEKPFRPEVVEMLERELESSIKSVLNRVQAEKQVKWAKTALEGRVRKMQRDCDDITRDLRKLQDSADKMHRRLYECPKIKIRELPPFDLNTGRPYPPEADVTLPPLGELKRPPIGVIGTYFAVRNKAIASWLPCKVIESMDVVISGQKSVKYYKVKYLRLKVPTIKCVSAKHMAYGDAPTVRLSIGTRVIALFDGSTLSKNNKETIAPSAFYPGIVAEQLQVYNKYRYLIFFDDGYAQYVHHKDVRVVCQAAENVWEDVHPASREFIHNYLSQYQKHRPMVQVKKGQSMITESNGKWLYAKVVDVDASLVQMQFDGQNRYEWIYRGSTRLGPLFKEKQLNGMTKAPLAIQRRSEPYVRYDEETTRNDASQSQNRTPEKQQTRAVAKKSTASQPRPDSQQAASNAPVVKHLNNSTIFLEDDNRPKGKVVYYTAKKNLPPKPFVPHECKPSCLFTITHNLHSYSPLAKPLLSGWERQIFKSKLKKSVVYRAPCGRRLRNMEELHRYLRLTKNVLNVDNFDFDCAIHCLAEYVIESSIVSKADLSNGVENMVIPCVNYYDNTMPPYCEYSLDRIPTEGVKLNLDPNFLVGCDCDDDCADKSKCSCWQLTLSGARFGNPNTPPENVGYCFKRLLDPVPTGIYECNANCKCKKNCLNRVVQTPLQVKLQVFKTSNRGWGLRCLNDIPKGTFICIYAGHLLTEQKANEGGVNASDEYFAELDYIEVVERLKEGYESDVQEENESEDEEIEEPNLDADSDEDFRSKCNVNNKDASINTRLRTRRVTTDDDKRKKKGTEGVEESQERQVINFEPNTSLSNEEQATSNTKYKSIRRYFGKNEFCYIMDAKKTGNIGRYFNHSCSPNLFVQNVFVDSQDLRFPWVAFFALTHIRAGTELTWNYNYEVGIVPGKVLYCECGAPNCRGRLL